MHLTGGNGYADTIGAPDEAFAGALVGGTYLGKFVQLRSLSVGTNYLLH